MNKILMLIISFISISCFAFAPATTNTNAALAKLVCDQALPTTDANFCPSFHAVATCHCVQLGFPSAVCQNMDLLWKAMLGRYGSVEVACSPQVQKDTTPQNCIDDWNCYRNGGVNSQGAACRGTGKPC